MTALDSELLARIAHLRLHAMRTVEGMLAGLHRSPHRGASMTFVEHRDYVPGDDPRLLDWRAFARNDRYVIRRFEQESQQTAYVALDASASMQFGDSEALTRKADYAATLLCGIAYVLLRQGDAVGAFLFDDMVRQSLPARQRPKHFESIVELLSRQATDGAGTALDAAWNSLLEQTQHRRLLVIASDLIDFSDNALVALSTMRGLEHEVILFHVLHRDEVELAIVGPTHVEGLERESPLDVDASALRAAYQNELQAWLTRCEQACVGAGVRYVRAITDTPPETVLARTLIESRRHGWGSWG
jgi:uncharacterized protein (DUF58 family)